MSADRSETSLLIHIGYHKTATSWMQETLFRPDCGYAPLMSHAEVFEHITGPHPLVFDPEPTRALLAARSAEAPAGLARVVSSEILSGNPLRGGQDCAENARRLQRIAPDARILVTIREQLSMAASMYMQYISRGGALPASRFFDGPLDFGYPLFDPVHLEYHRLVGFYRELFGPARVHVLTFEQFRAAPEDFVASIDRLAGAPGISTAAVRAARSGRNVSSPEYAVPLLRRVNHLRAGPVSPDPILDLGEGSRLLYRSIRRAANAMPVRRLVRRPNPVRDLIATRFSGRFEASNRALAALCPELSLRDYPGISSEARAAPEIPRSA